MNKLWAGDVQGRHHGAGVHELILGAPVDGHACAGDQGVQVPYPALPNHVLQQLLPGVDVRSGQRKILNPGLSIKSFLPPPRALFPVFGELYLILWPFSSVKIFSIFFFPFFPSLKFLGGGHVPPSPSLEYDPARDKWHEFIYI